MIFDLGGISHFARENQYPVEWSEVENRQLLDSCYQPTEWDIYWRLEPCEFVMHKIEREKGLFGTSAIPKAWLLAMARHPIAYLEHRSAFMWNFLAGSNPTMWVADIEHPPERIFQDRPAFTALVSLHDALKPTPLFRAGSWLVLCLAVCWFGWRWADTREGAFALGTCGSAVIYVLATILSALRPTFAMPIGPWWPVLWAPSSRRRHPALCRVRSKAAAATALELLAPTPPSRICNRLRRRSAAF